MGETFFQMLHLTILMLGEYGYMRMEESLAGYLSSGVASSWKASVFASRLVDKAYAMTGQAGGALHTMEVPGRFIEGFDHSRGVTPDASLELRHSTTLLPLTAHLLSWLPWRDIYGLTCQGLKRRKEHSS